MQFFKNSSYIFVVCSLLIAFIGLAKSVFFAKYMEFDELGYLALFQTITGLVATFHFGVLSGGYRLASYYDDSEFDKVNSQVYSLISIMIFLFVTVALILGLVGFSAWNSQLLFLGVFCGCTTLFSNWAINISIAKNNLSIVNKAQLCGAISSLITVPFIFRFGLFAAYASLIIQPLIVFAVLARLTNYTLPRFWKFDSAVSLELFRYGFFPFIAALCFICYQQLEKVFIANTLSVEVLGHLTLFYLTFTIWSIFPDALTRIYFPRATFLFENNKMEEYENLLNKHLIIVFIYCVAVSILFFCFAESIVSYVLDQHLEFLYLVKLGFAAFILKALSENSAIRLLSIGANKKILLVDAASFFFYVFLFLFFWYFHRLSIIVFVGMSVFYYLVKFILLNVFSKFCKEYLK